MITYLRVLSSSSDIKSYIYPFEKNDSAKLLYQNGYSNLDRKIKCLFYIISCFSNIGLDLNFSKHVCFCKNDTY